MATDKHDKLAQLALARQLTNIIPGQLARALFAPDIQEATYYIPAIIGEVLIVVGYLGSSAVAITELVEIAKAGSPAVVSPGLADALRLGPGQPCLQP